MVYSMLHVHLQMRVKKPPLRFWTLNAAGINAPGRRQLCERESRSTLCAPGIIILRVMCLFIIQSLCSFSVFLSFFFFLTIYRLLFHGILYREVSASSFQVPAAAAASNRCIIIAAEHASFT